MNGILRRLAAMTLLACIATSVFALPAVAASKHPISGTCRNDAQWYISEIDRKVQTNSTSIRASFYDLCVRPMYVKLIHVDTGAQLGVTIVASGDAQTLATGVRAGTMFNNAFKLASPCYPWQDRTFSGYEWY